MNNKIFKNYTEKITCKFTAQGAVMPALSAVFYFK